MLIINSIKNCEISRDTYIKNSLKKLFNIFAKRFRSYYDLMINELTIDHDDL